MELFIDSLYTLAGLILLIGGAHFLVEGAVGLAKRIGLSSLMVGLTVVAFGTSAPELAAAILSVLKDRSELAVGTVVGSNIANIGLVLAVTVLIYPVTCSLRVIRYEVPVMIGVSLLGAILMMDGNISRIDGGFLASILIAYVAIGYLNGKKDAAVEAAIAAELQREVGVLPGRPLLLIILAVLASLGALAYGADLLVEGATGLAEAAGVSPFLIGIFMVAVSTSLPELATGVIAARKQHPDIVLGNVLGSNVFNILCVLGISAQVGPLHVPDNATIVDLWVMLGFAVVCLPVMVTGFRISRREGVLLLIAYLVYAVVSFAL